MFPLTRVMNNSRFKANKDRLLEIFFKRQNGKCFYCRKKCILYSQIPNNEALFFDLKSSHFQNLSPKNKKIVLRVNSLRRRRFYAIRMFSLDHKVSRKNGGKHYIKNFVGACRQCN